MRLGKTALFHFISQIVISVSGFLATFAIVVILGADGLGLYRVAVAVGFYWLVIPSSGVATAIKKRMSEGTDPSRYYGAGIVLNGVIAGGMGGLVLIVGFLLSSINLPDVVFVRILVDYNGEVATLLVGATALETSLAGLEGQKRVARSGAMRALERVGRSLVQIILIAGGFAVTAITLGHAATLVIVASLGLWVASVRPAIPRYEHIQSLASFAQYSWMGALRGRVYGWMDTLVLSLFLGSAALIGTYEVAWGVGSLLATVSASISSTLFPEVSDLSSDGDFRRVRHYLDEALAYAGLIVIPGFLGAIVIGPRVLRFFRPELVRGSTVLVILVFAYLVDVYATQLLNVINGIDRPDIAFRINAAFITLNVVLNVVLVLQFGWQGAAVATAASAGARMVAGYVALERTISGVSIPVRPLLAQVFASFAMIVVVLPIHETLPRSRGWTLAVVTLGAGIYFLALLALSGRVRDKARMLSPVGV
jgi:O-antigen/teichoic acid export membrane protein